MGMPYKWIVNGRVVKNKEDYEGCCGSDCDDCDDCGCGGKKKG